MTKARKPNSTPSWMDEAHDDFCRVFKDEQVAPRIASAFIDRWIDRCETEHEADLFEQAVKEWLLIRAAVRCASDDSQSSDATN